MDVDSFNTIDNLETDSMTLKNLGNAAYKANNLEVRIKLHDRHHVYFTFAYRKRFSISAKQLI